MVATTTAVPAGRRLRPPSSAQRVLGRHPEAWVYAVAAGAAALLLVETVGSVAPSAPTEGDPPWLPAWSGWMLMVLAMMLPIVAPDARRVALRSLWRRRHRAMIGFLSGYLAVWAAVGLVVVGALHAAHLSHPPVGVTVAALLAAALWQVSPPRRRALRRCGPVRLGAAQGRAADLDCAAAGWRGGLLCVVTCGPVMLATAAGHHYPVLMAGLLALFLGERARGPNPERRAGRPLEAWGIVGLAGLVILAAVP